MQNKIHPFVQRACELKAIPFDESKILRLSYYHYIIDYSQDFLNNEAKKVYLINCRKRMILQHSGLVQKMLLCLWVSRYIDLDLSSLPNGNIEDYVKERHDIKNYMLFVSFSDYNQNDVSFVTYCVYELDIFGTYLFEVANVKANHWEGPQQLENLDLIVKIIESKTIIPI